MRTLPWLVALLGAWSFTAATFAASVPGVETKTVYLSGHGTDDAVLWDFYVNGGRRANAWAKIPVPSCWEQQGFGDYDYGLEYRTQRNQPPPAPIPSEQGFYRYDFPVPAEWSGQTVRIVFDGVMTDADVKINGQSAGPAHQGSFYEFKYDITSLLKFGATNRLEIWVSKESANASVNTAERRGDYWNFGGIFRPVFLEVVPKQYIDWTAVDAKADGSFTAQVHLGGTAYSPTTVYAQVYDAQDQPVGAPFSTDIETSTGADTATLHANFPGVKLWTAETPNLYHVRFSLENKFAQIAQPGHTVTTRFGFRTIELREGDGIYVNGQRVILKGVNRHSFWPETGRALNRQICYDDVKLIKEANMNAVRMSHYPPDRDFLEACDELGLYVLDELGGWQGSYDTPTGQKLIGEMVRRDVNHPSILFWDNGNEGGWNTANDGEFAKWDPQQRHVFHPRSTDHGVNDPHYPTYDQVVAKVNGPDVYLPTEFLHGLYDGGAGTGLHDFWAAMIQGKTFAGGFIWAFLDEAVARTDEDGKLDSRKNLAPDGIVGPHREKEGSFYTIRQIWSPVQVSDLKLENGVLSAQVENDYDFNNLNTCTFTWEVGRLHTLFDDQAGHDTVVSGEFRGPDVAAHGKTTIQQQVSWHDSTAGSQYVAYLTAKDSAGRALWTWALPLPNDAEPSSDKSPASPSATVREDAQQWVAKAGNLEMHFSKATGLLTGVTADGRTVSLGNGPRFLAYLHDKGTTPGVGGGTVPMIYNDVAAAGALTKLSAHTDGGKAIVEASYRGPLKQVTWTINGSSATLDYTYTFDGPADLLGVNFDYPEANMKSITWAGWGPYRVWKNRMDGGTFDVWHNAHNDPVPGVSWEYPEFQGYFRWNWANFATTEGHLMVRHLGSGENFLGVYTPHDAPADAGPLQVLPPTGLAFLDAIPPMRDKGKWPEQLGPQSATKTFTGETTGHVQFFFPAN